MVGLVERSDDQTSPSGLTLLNRGTGVVHELVVDLFLTSQSSSPVAITEDEKIEER